MPSEPLACLDGTFSPASEAKVPILDRGFLFGDAVYEVMRLYDGRMWLEAEHMARLRPEPPRTPDRPASTASGSKPGSPSRSRRSGVAEGTVYIQITRGVAPRRHRFPEPGTPPTELIVVSPYDDAATAARRRSGVPVVSRPDLRWGRCDVKSVNLLGNVLACEEAHRHGCIEARPRRPRRVRHRGDALLAALGPRRPARRDARGAGHPAGDEPGVPPPAGRVARRPLRRGPVTLDELKAADEVMLSGTTIEVMPVVRIDDATIGDGTPGPGRPPDRRGASPRPSAGSAAGSTRSPSPARSAGGA